jgi:transposase-like protein
MQSKDISAAQRANIVIEILREQETVAQIAGKYGVNPKTLYAWKKEFLENAPKIFGADKQKPAAEKEREIESLYQQIGQLQVEVNWLKKKSATLKIR